MGSGAEGQRINANAKPSLDAHPLIRTRAAEWNLDTNRIGVMGFSAGGEVAAMLIYSPTAGDPDSKDPVERLDCHSDFQIVIYPGPLGIPEQIPSNAPPAFFVVANDDNSHVGPVLAQIEKYRQVRRPVEVHLYARGGHGFNLGRRSKYSSIKGWPQRMTEWMEDSGFISNH